MSSTNLEDRMDFILANVDQPVTNEEQIQYAILLTLQEVCRTLYRIWQDTGTG